MRLDENFISVRFAERALLRLAAAALVMGVAWTGGARAVSAETLRSALAAAYMTNPTLNAERAKLRAIDEEASQARSICFAWSRLRAEQAGLLDALHWARSLP